MTPEEEAATRALVAEIGAISARDPQFRQLTTLRDVLAGVLAALDAERAARANIVGSLVERAEKAERDIAALREVAAAARACGQAEDAYDIMCGENEDGGGHEPERMGAAGEACDTAMRALRAALARLP